MFDSIDSLKRAGFEGFISLSEATKVARPQSGVYLVLREPALGGPKFLSTGTGGWFKHEDPNVGLDKLENNWIDGALVLYIGKADRGKSGRGVSKRLDDLHRFGSGKPAAHRGGKLLWQIADSDKFLICWKYCASKESPRDNEVSLLQLFEATYDQLPFANLQH